MKPAIPLCKLHPDFHLPEDVIVGAGFDARAYVRRLKKCHVDAVVFFAKCHYGFAYYPSKFGTVHPGLQMDMLGAMAEACRAEHVRLICYYSVFLDTAAVRKHPNWMLRSAQNAVDGVFNSNKFLSLCVNSGYADELLIPQTLEILRRYDVAEMFFDTMSGFQPCYCEACRSAFGQPISTANTGPHWLPYVRWYFDQYENFFAKVAAAIYRVRPKVDVTFNWKWAYNQPNQPVPHITRLAGDLYPTGTVASQACRYWTGTGYPFDYMCGRFLHGLSEWQNNTPETLKYTAAATIANGGSFYLIDRQLPDGSLEDRAYRIDADVFEFVSARCAVVTGTQPVPEIAALYPFDHVMGPDLRFFPELKVRTARLDPFNGLARLMMDRARHYTAFNTENFISQINRHRLAILPELEFLDAPTKEALRRFVEKGGTALITQAAQVDPEILDFAGVNYDGHTALEYGYLDTPEPIMVRGQFAQVTPRDGAETICAVVPPLAAGKGGAQFGHGFAPPTKAGKYAAAVLRRLGKGQVIYVAAPVFRSHWQYPNPALAEFILGLIDRLMPDPVVKVTTRAHVEMAARRRGKDLIVHLVNHSGKQRLGGYWAPATEYMPRITGIRVAIRGLTALSRVRREPAGKAVRVQNGAVRVNLDIMESLVVEGYFQ